MPHKEEPIFPKYCEQIYKTVRRPTRTVSIGKVLVGSQHPIALQTMTTTDTRDVMGTVTQVDPFCLSTSTVARASSVTSLSASVWQK